MDSADQLYARAERYRRMASIFYEENGRVGATLLDIADELEAKATSLAEAGQHLNSEAATDD
jgi:hypothetical protein